MRYFLWTGCAIIITSIVIHIRRHNALVQYLQEAKLNDHHRLRRSASGRVNKSIENDFIYSL